jgi:6-phosphogluconolactonase
MEAAVKAAPAVHIQVLKDYDALSRAAAQLFLERGKDALAERGRFAAALSGGSTPRRFYALLGSSPYLDALDWHRVHVFWADERCVPPDHRESNFELVHDTLLSSIDIPNGNIHRIRGEEGPDGAAREYEQDIKTFFGVDRPVFDLIVLGVGEDGHTASVFPYSEAVRETGRIVMPVFLDKPKLHRVTLTLPVINLAAHIVILASGRSKAAIVREILSEENLKKYPAGLVRPVSGDLIWLIDSEAAEQLK